MADQIITNSRNIKYPNSKTPTGSGNTSVGGGINVPNAPQGTTGNAPTSSR